MSAMLFSHIAAGAFALVFGFVALYAAKGATVHRKAGLLFVYAIVAMAVFGLAVAVGRGVAPAMNIPRALLTACLAITALTSVRAADAQSQRIDAFAMLLTLGAGVISLLFGFEAIAHGGKRLGVPATQFLMLAAVGLIAGFGDLRMLTRPGSFERAHLLARHIWRMCVALLISTLALVVGQAQVIPAPLSKPFLLALPVLAIVLSMLYWLRRVRAKDNRARLDFLSLKPTA